MPISLPEHFEEFADARRKGFLAVKELKESGQKICGTFYQYTPTEILRAAGLYEVGLCGKSAAPIKTAETRLPANLCPLIKASYGHVLEDSCPYAYFSDIVVGETTCDGKKKMYELLTRQEQLYYYQVPQGEDRSYVNPLIRMLQQRFGAKVTDEKLRVASESFNRQRQSVMDLMAVQQQIPPAAWGSEILEALEAGRHHLNPVDRAKANEDARAVFLTRSSPVPKSACRILVTGCPASAVYQKVVGAVEQNGGVVVCFENCEVVNSNRRHVDTAADDIIGAIADCYQDTACAIMAPNDRRFRILGELAGDYHVDGIIDLALQTCHAYTVERDKMRRFCLEKGIPYLPVETGFTDADAGQIETRVSAFIEML